MPVSGEFVAGFPHFHATLQHMWVVAADPNEFLPEALLVHANLLNATDRTPHVWPIELFRFGWEVDSLQRSIMKCLGAKDVRCVFANAHSLPKTPVYPPHIYNATPHLAWSTNTCFSWQFNEGDHVTILAFNAASRIRTVQHSHWHAYAKLRS